MNGVFRDLSGITNLDVSSWDTSAVTNMSSMFNGIRLTNLDVSNWDTSRVTTMNSMFSGATIINANLSNWDLSSVTTRTNMFGSISALFRITNLNVSNWSITGDISDLFRRTSGLTSLDVSGWDMSHVTHVSNMLMNTTSLRQLVLGSDFRLNGTALPAIRSTTDYTGFWQNVGNGTVENPTGEFVLSSAQLMAQYDGEMIADTWVWQPVLRTYRITFDANGGENAPATQTKTEGTELILTEEIPTRFGYVFLGWSTSNDASVAEYQSGENFSRNESVTLFAVWQEEDSCNVIFEGQFANQAVNQGGLTGSLWRICEDGVLEVGAGFINWTSTSSPWNGHRARITRIVFEGEITAGPSLTNLFRNLTAVTTIEGLGYFDTSQVTNMNSMFSGMSNVSSLDVSGFDTSQATNMGSMFSGMSNVSSLDVSGFDTSQVTNMSGMFSGMSNVSSLDVSSFDTSQAMNMSSMFASTNRLENLTLGENFIFRNNVGLPLVRTTTEFTGFWQNVGNGTIENPSGEFILTSEQLVAQYEGQTMADTWVWQRVSTN
jgi:uncharacterized repeat protein (TIGR02543 family)